MQRKVQFGVVPVNIETLLEVNVFLVNNEIQLAKFVKQNIYGKKIVIGMGAGSVSNWIRNLPKLV